MARTKQRPTPQKPAAALCLHGHGAIKGPKKGLPGTAEETADSKRGGMRRAAAQKATDAIRVWAGSILAMDGEEAARQRKKKLENRRGTRSAQRVPSDMKTTPPPGEQVAFLAPAAPFSLPVASTPPPRHRVPHLAPSCRSHQERHRRHHHRQWNCSSQREGSVPSVVLLSLPPSDATPASVGWQPGQRRTRRRPWTAACSGGGSGDGSVGGDGGGSIGTPHPAERERTGPDVGTHSGRGKSVGELSMALGATATGMIAGTEIEPASAHRVDKLVETGSRGTQGGGGGSGSGSRRGGVDGERDEGRGTRRETADDGKDGGGALPCALGAVAAATSARVPAAGEAAPTPHAEGKVAQARGEAEAEASAEAATAAATSTQAVAETVSGPRATLDEPPQPAAAGEIKDKDKDGFGEHGWFSPTSEVEAGVGSVFSWTAHAQAQPRSGDEPSPEKAASSREKTPESAGASGSKGEDIKGVREEDKEDNTSDNSWSERRRLVEDWEEHDEVWLSMRQEAKAAAEKEPLLVSFVYSTILNQKTLEAAVAFHLANKLAGPHMLSTQVQALVREYFADASTPFRRNLRRDIIAVRERDPACDSYHDCLLYFKGFQALQTHRVAHWLYKSGRHALAFYLQSQVNQEFQIDIHPGAKFGEGVFIDHGTGIVVGETAVVGDDVSMLHRVTLGGSGVKSADRHPKIGNGVLIGAGACLLGNISVGKGTQIGAGSLVVIDLPERCVAVGVPAKVLGQGKNRKPALAMDQDCFKKVWKGLDI